MHGLSLGEAGALLHRHSGAQYRVSMTWLQAGLEHCVHQEEFDSLVFVLGMGLEPLTNPSSRMKVGAPKHLGQLEWGGH